jgi:hypothetical protein
MADQNVNIKVKIGVDTGNTEEQAKKATDGVDKIAKSAKQAETNAKKAGSAFSSIGNALKSLGIIALVNKGFEFFQQVLGKNQKVADFLSTSVNFLTSVFSDLVAFLIDNTQPVIDFFKSIFENPKQLLEDFATAIKENFLERVRSLIDAYGLLGSIIKNVFKGNFDEAIKDAKSFGKEVVDVFTGVDGTVDRASKAISDAADATSKYVKSKVDQAKALTEATNNAIIAEASLTKAIKLTENEAEKLRQKRDDENASLQERIKANEQLAEVLKKGQEQEFALLAIREQAINREIASNGINIQNQAELIKLAGERADIEEKYTAFASEQLVNRTALLNEERENVRKVAEAENKRLLDQQKAAADTIKDEVAKLEAKRTILEQENELELQRLQNVIDNTTAGTTARIDAEIEYQNKKNEIAIQLAQTDDQLAVARFTKELEGLQRLRTAEGVAYEERLASLDAEQVALDEAFENRLISEKDYNDKVKALTDQRIAYQDAELQAKLEFAAAVGSIFGQLAGLFEQGTAAAKVAALAEIAIGTGVGFINGLDIAQKSAKATGPGAAFAFPIFYATQIAAVLGAASRAKSIIATTRGGGGAAGGNPSAPVNPSAPIAPTAPSPIQTTLDTAAFSTITNQPARAYVVESDVSNSQERIRRINRAATFG